MRSIICLLALLLLSTPSSATSHLHNKYASSCSFSLVEVRSLLFYNVLCDLVLVPHSSPRPPSCLPYSLYPSTWILPLYLPSQLHRPSSNSRQLQKVSRLGFSSAPELPQRVQMKCNTRAATIDIASFYWSLTGGDAALDGQVCAQCRHVTLRRDSRLLHG